MTTVTINIEALEELRARTGCKDIADLTNRALTFYGAAAEQVAEGRKIIAVDKQKNEHRVMTFLPRKRTSTKVTATPV